MIRNFQSIQQRFTDQNSNWIIGLSDENPEERVKIQENRQHLSLFILTVLIKFEIINQFLVSKQKLPKNYFCVLDPLLEYANIDEETLISNIPDINSYSNTKEVHSSILSYSRSLQNLEIPENNSNRYRNFLVKTKGSAKPIIEESFMLTKFEELNSIKKTHFLSRNSTVDKIEIVNPNRELLPPLTTDGYSQSESLRKIESKQSFQIFKPSEVFSDEFSDKPEFMLASSTYFKRKKT